ncbi:outer membrane beta-barrel protein [uncultured Draconibacterium sp.]|uniref:outer membrane beta-barrel protein n=1 Tax=uncultured Draconibacterium sp. TaxID=1573823 RepID=UPI0025EB40D6|nr:outer membrane beta-barrel protein [uncultured Draconibacterium sp.]
MLKKIFFVALIMSVCVTTFAQIKFETGYFIDNSNQKIQCLIKNEGWVITPSSFKYKKNDNAPVETATIQNVKEFGIPGSVKYKRLDVEIDTSPDKQNELSLVRNPEYQEKQLFLKVILEGQPSLFEYKDRTLTRYFYGLNDDVVQLVYKRYMTNDKVAENNYFRNQLSSILKCDEITQQNVAGTDYFRSDLKKLFITYHKSTNADYNELEMKKKLKVHMSIKPGINANSFTVTNPNSLVERAEFDNKTNFRLGVEAEFLLPIKKYKWSFFVEPTYQKYNSESSVKVNPARWPAGVIEGEVKYESIEMPIGLRYHMYLNDVSKIFVDMALVMDFALDSYVDFSNYQNNLDIESSSNIAFGLGYKFKDKIDLTFRYYTTRDILNGYTIWYGKYEAFSVSLGYTLF